jgi:hypothetical protein
MGWCISEESSGRAVKEKAKKNMLRNSWGMEDREQNSVCQTSREGNSS